MYGSEESDDIFDKAVADDMIGMAHTILCSDVLMLEIRVSSPSNLLCTVLVSSRGSLHELQVAIGEQTGVAPHLQRLFFGVRELARSDDLRGLLPAEGEQHVDLLLMKRSEDQLIWIQKIESIPGVLVENWLRDEAPEEALQDSEVILAAVTRYANTFNYASPELRANRLFAIEAVARNKHVMYHVAPEWKQDREFVLAAVARNGFALRDAAPSLRADREVVLTAVAQDGKALTFAARALQADPEIHSVAARYM